MEKKEKKRKINLFEEFGFHLKLNLFYKGLVSTLNTVTLKNQKLVLFKVKKKKKRS